MAQLLIPATVEPGMGRDSRDYRAAWFKSFPRVSQNVSRIFDMLQNVQKHDSSQGLSVNGPRLAKIVNSNVFNASLPNVLYRLRHQIESRHIETQLVELNKVSTGPDSPFDKSSRWRTMLLKQLKDELPLGNVPPVTVFQFNKFPEMTGVHEFRLCVDFKVRTSLGRTHALREGKSLLKPSTQKRRDAFWHHKP